MLSAKHERLICSACCPWFPPDVITPPIVRQPRGTNAKCQHHRLLYEMLQPYRSPVQVGMLPTTIFSLPQLEVSSLRYPAPRLRGLLHSRSLQLLTLTQLHRQSRGKS